VEQIILLHRRGGLGSVVVGFTHLPKGPLVHPLGHAEVVPKREQV